MNRTDPKKPDAIAIQNLGMTFRDKNGITEALKGISFQVASQDFVCILGPSGSGKTTLLRILAGLVKPSSGRVNFSQAKAKPIIGLVFQQANLMPWRTVEENISLPLELKGEKQADAVAQTRAMVDLVGLQEFTHAWPASLSGGMAQRVALARALIQDPDVLLLDEPFGGLDALTRERMGVELLRIWQSRRKTVLMVTHSISEALLLADRIIMLTPRPGRILLDVRVDLPRPRQEEVRYSPKFIELSKALRSAIG
jgi:NitT/TauT family transport system ATP-binding protein